MEDFAVASSFDLKLLQRQAKRSREDAFSEDIPDAKRPNFGGDKKPLDNPIFMNDPPSLEKGVETLIVTTADRHHGVTPNARALAETVPSESARTTVLLGDARVALSDLESGAHSVVPPLTTKQFFNKFVSVTDEGCKKIVSFPQRSTEWLAARKYRITASQYGTFMGVSKFATPSQALSEKLWETFHGNAACTWGTMQEPCACEDYHRWALDGLQRKCIELGKDPLSARLAVEERGLMVFPSSPWMGVSPDGIVTYTDPVTGKMKRRLLEIKCPYYRHRFDGRHPYQGQGPGGCKPEYYAQIQGIMGCLWQEDERRKDRDELEDLFEISECDFVVWQPNGMFISRLPFDREYFLKQLKPKLREFYLGKFLPAATDQYNGKLKDGQTRAAHRVKVDI